MLSGAGSGWSGRVQREAQEGYLTGLLRVRLHHPDSLGRLCMGTCGSGPSTRLLHRRGSIVGNGEGCPQSAPLTEREGRRLVELVDRGGQAARLYERQQGVVILFGLVEAGEVVLGVVLEHGDEIISQMDGYSISPKSFQLFIKRAPFDEGKLLEVMETEYCLVQKLGPVIDDAIDAVRG